jgi:hypothetical protein
MKTYQFGLPDSDRVITITAATFKEARKMFIAQLRAEGLV